MTAGDAIHFLIFVYLFLISIQDHRPLVGFAVGCRRRCALLKEPVLVTIVFSGPRVLEIVEELVS